MYPPDQRPPPWFVPPDPNHQPQATWQPPGGISHDQWVGCHGMSCDEWRRTEEKVTRLIGSTTPFIGSNAASGILVRIIMRRTISLSYKLPSWEMSDSEFKFDIYNLPNITD